MSPDARKSPSHLWFSAVTLRSDWLSFSSCSWGYGICGWCLKVVGNSQALSFQVLLQPNLLSPLSEMTIKHKLDLLTVISDSYPVF